ncbi:MAG: UDP-N-acetylmuramate--L-alanine ligase [Cytophagaceae bacterium]
MKGIEKIYFVGIGGIGMSALARWFKASGCVVAGYDRTPTALTNQLTDEGIDIHFDDDVNLIPADFKEKKGTLVVFTPAVPSEHSELVYFLNQGFEVKKRSEVLGMITKNHPSIAVAGTHGKTTTTSMIAHVLKYANVDCVAFLGGITQNYNTNLLLNSGPNPWVVVEADEYDRSFLRLNPKVAVVTTMDADHLDIYDNEGEFIKAFNEFADQIEEGGSLVHREGLALKSSSIGVLIETFGSGAATYKVSNVKADHGWFVFDLETPQKKIIGARMQVPGMHNVMNALAAWACGRIVGISDEVIAEAIENFKGVKRRFEYHIKGQRIIYIDDYAHHPTEIEACLDAVRMLYPGKHITVAFQPHLFSRTRDFMEGFVHSLSKADGVVLLDIYPAREKPLEGITSEVLLQKISAANKQLVTKEELPSVLARLQTDVVVTMGAGDIDKLVEPVKLKLEEVYEI